MASADEPLFCDRCLARLICGEGNFFQVTIDAVADPTPPRFDAADVDAAQLRRELEQLVGQLDAFSARELADQVHRRVVIHLCSRCFRVWIENPAGQP